ncbi:nuclear transport factor 2 family protein [Paucibacter sp. R3-3]|uniref:Nuclear transport factor 2 family protein n=1 Tax=Roseateles agri TaxID=3098619 RepID=A0ABU5DP79_9BURK|nr:nuclear transport factor 2 family protein [Paucibacter sp. R3-3]MDY0748121.1 nuclear transport factor 2 family protein [Paucibacter sp. R3-3]
MGQRQEDFIREFCASFGDGSYETRPDVDRILSMMAENAEWQLWVPGGPKISGRAAIRQELERQMGFLRQNRCNIKNILSSDRLVMTERVDDAVLYGRDAWHTMVAVYVLDDQGLISEWREYLDMADLAAKKKGPVLPAYRDQYGETGESP